MTEPQGPVNANQAEAPPGSLRLLRFIILVTAAAVIAPIADVGDALVTLFLVLIAPLPFYLAFGLLWRDDQRPRLLAGLALARAIGLTHAPFFIFMAYEDLFVSWPTHPVLVALLAILFALQVILIWLSWSLFARLRRLPQGETKPGRERFFKVLGQSILAVYVIAFVLSPLGFGDHALSRGESAVISDLRYFSSTQVAYASANGGFFGTPECLATPSRCIPDYPATAPVFLYADSVRARSHGYVFTLRTGRIPTAEDLQNAKAAPGSFSNWAYYAVPEAPGRSGFRSFCIDQDGVLRHTTDGSIPDTSQSVCPASMTVIM
jgi:hypothetical protein